MSTCASSNCGYYYKAIGDEYPHCHYPDDGSKAPCEYEEEPEELEDDCDYEVGFDPYSGCYTDDC